MKLKYTFFSIIFTTLCSTSVYSQQEPAMPKISLKESFDDLMDTINDPEYSFLLLEDRLILGILSIMIEQMFDPQVVGMQVPEHYLIQLKSKLTNDLVFKLETTPRKLYLIEKLGLIPIIASGVFFLIGCLISLKLFGEETKASPFFGLFAITLIVSIVELIAKIYRIYHRLIFVQNELVEELSNQASSGGRMF